MQQSGARFPAGQGQVAGAIDVYLEGFLDLFLAVIHPMEGSGVDDDVRGVGTNGEVHLGPARHVKFAMAEGGELLVGENLGQVGCELTASAG